MGKSRAAIKNILFPVDFSPSCIAMAGFVKRAAAMFSSKVILLHVLEPYSSGFELYVRPAPEVQENREQVARETLDSFLKLEFPPQEHFRLLLSGDAATRIAGVVKTCGIDLIVMPTHSGFFRSMLLGSTTAKVLNDAPCPVLTSRHAEEMTPRPIEHRQWVCAIGLQPDSERVLGFARQLTESVHAHLTLLHAIPAGDAGPPFQLDFEEHVESEKRRAVHHRLAEFQKAAVSRAGTLIALGPTKDALVEAILRLQADVLIIGRTPLDHDSGRMRDLTHAISSDAPCPVLSV